MNVWQFGIDLNCMLERKSYYGNRIQNERPTRQKIFVKLIKQGLSDVEIRKVYNKSDLSYRSISQIKTWIRYYREKIENGEL